MKYSKFSLIFLFAVTLFAYPTLKKEIEVQPGQKLVVEIKAGSDIIIEGWDKNIVDIDAEIKGRDADDVQLEASKTSYGVFLKAYFVEKKHSNSTNGTVKVRVPNKFDLDLETMGGELDVSNVKGTLKGSTMGGKLLLKNLKGNISFSTMGGSVELTDSEVDGKVSTMGGKVLVENVVGDVDASSMGGNVIQRNVKGSKSSVGKEVNIKTMGGAINIDEAMNGASLNTMGGNITVNKAAEYVKATTMGGDIEIKEISGWVDASTMGGDVEVKVKGSDGKRDIKLSSMGGDMKLYVPADLDMDIEIEIVFNENRRDKVEIVSDFNLTENIVDADSDYNNAKKLIGTGITGSGKNKVKIKTIAGKVHLLKI